MQGNMIEFSSRLSVFCLLAYEKKKNT